jgi:hypothetical protein
LGWKAPIPSARQFSMYISYVPPSDELDKPRRLSELGLSSYESNVFSLCKYDVWPMCSRARFQRPSYFDVATEDINRFHLRCSCIRSDDLTERFEMHRSDVLCDQRAGIPLTIDFGKCRACRNHIYPCFAKVLRTVENNQKLAFLDCQTNEQINSTVL